MLVHVWNFIAAWQANAHPEWAACQKYLLDLCGVSGESKPGIASTGMAHLCIRDVYCEQKNRTIFTVYP